MTSYWSRRQQLKPAKRAVMPDLAELLSVERASSLTDHLAALVGALSIRRHIADLRRLAAAGNLKVGRHTYGLPTIYVSHPEDRVVIGSFSSIAPGVVLIPGGLHPTSGVSTFPFLRRWNLEDVDSSVGRRGPILIGHDAWLCTGSQILSGVTIGVGAVVAAGAVAISDVPPYAIAGGVPAKVIGYRFDQATCAELLATRWWEWSDDELRDVLPLLTAMEVGPFLAHARRRNAKFTDQEYGERE